MKKAAPGKAACGNIHFAPNSQADYDWNNATPVKSECFDWLLNFPNFKGDVRTVDATLWGSGDTRAHHNGGSNISHMWLAGKMESITIGGSMW
ncbi:MAG: hypothetical protein HC797_01595 [Anaerolineales bacterium]|nr:hypothetical protein [Anaerolineales bacterium]